MPPEVCYDANADMTSIVEVPHNLLLIAKTLVITDVLEEANAIKFVVDNFHDLIEIKFRPRAYNNDDVGRFLNQPDLLLLKRINFPYLRKLSGEMLIDFDSLFSDDLSDLDASELILKFNWLSDTDRYPRIWKNATVITTPSGINALIIGIEQHNEMIYFDINLHYLFTNGTLWNWPLCRAH